MKGRELYYFYIILGTISSLLGFFVFFYVKPMYQRITGLIVGIAGFLFIIVSLLVLRILSGG